MVNMSSPTRGHFSDSQSLLGIDKDASLGRSSEDIESYIPSAKRKSLGDCCGPWIIHLFFACIYTTLFFAVWEQTRPEEKGASGYHDTHSQAYSKTFLLTKILLAKNLQGPAWKALKWETRLLNNQLDVSNPYKGLPRPEFEKAWDELLEPTAIKVDHETLERINRTSVPLLDGSGYMAALDVFHQLHCLVSLTTCFATRDIC